MQLDQHVLHVALDANVVAGLQFFLGENAELGEERTRLLRHELLQGLGSPAQVRKTTLLRLLHPLLRVVVPLEANGGRVLEHFSNNLEHGVVHRLCLFESFTQGIRDLANRVRDNSVQQRDRECDRRRRSNGAELELLSRERERRSAVAIGIVALNFRQLCDSQLDHLLLGGAGALSRGDLLDNAREHVAHENGDDGGRRFVGAKPVLVARGSDAGAE